MNTTIIRPTARGSLEQEIAERPRERLVPLLYEHLLGHLQEAKQRIESRDLEGKAHHLERALAILFELAATLDHERGGEIAPRLSALYTYFTGEITEIGKSLDVELLQRIINMIAMLHESWDVAASSGAR